jgi:DNA-binding response OmpR family regulator
MIEQSAGTVLIVDDESIIRESLQQWLEMEGFRVFTAENGDKALQICKFESLDVGVFDIRMPGMDGITLLGHTRVCSPDLDVIMMTAFASIEDAVKCISEGAHDYIIKPFPPEKLSKSIRHIMEARRLQAEQKDMAARQTLLGRFYQESLPYLLLGMATAAVSDDSWSAEKKRREPAEEEMSRSFKPLVDRVLQISHPAFGQDESDLYAITETALLLASMRTGIRHPFTLQPVQRGELPAAVPFVPAVLALQLFFEWLFQQTTSGTISLTKRSPKPSRVELQISLSATLPDQVRELVAASAEEQPLPAASLDLARLLFRRLGSTLDLPKPTGEGDRITLTFPVVQRK